MKVMNINSNIHLVNWPIPQVLAFTTTRYHPKQNSPALFNGPYDNFNLGLHVNDNPAQVLTNRATLKSLLPANVNIQWLEQVHGDHVVSVETLLAQPPQADAAYSCQENIALAIMTADCLPILISNHDGSEIAAIHGGWRPLAQNIISKTLAKFATPAAHLHVWLGPCIGKDNFEIGVEVKDTFVTQNTIFEAAFTPSAPNKYLADLHLIAKLQLSQLGVKQFYQQADCTMAQEQYYSYRRDQKTGRMASVICKG